MPFRYKHALLVLMVTIAFVLVGCAGNSQRASSALTTASPGVTSPAEAVVTAARAGGASLFASLPQSRTAEGYYVLGEADAPVLMEFYSDFL